MAKVKNNIKISVDSTDNTNKNHILFLTVLCERLTIIYSILKVRNPTSSTSMTRLSDAYCWSGTLGTSTAGEW